MKKDFQKWHKKKTDIDGVEKRPFFQEREIWFCHLGANVGFEQDGSGDDFLRPVMVFRKFNKEVFWAIPLTKASIAKKGKSSRFYYAFSFLPDVESVAVLSQIRLVDARRLARHIGSIPHKDFDIVKEKLKALFP